ncbi:TetR/AcrR family transcriptional regulator [Amycolatopsis sp. CA-230715]|uniref:TetR/AcrR family transcriptional regulator n=1 Tax=Amycolatopsis sp. CA-230715 TaxID=2745196 RepID=UPI001C02ECE3|nr:TetR/AcrR family transcriptional regulator [Amycolatopsis sp. CA-230715]QWF80041.1 hypothetical protein HUW46_03456 [Amycolatopsis sp. CA-230715]
MSKPTLRADARRNRERVLVAAHEAFAEEGPMVPLDEIARRAGVGAGTVYRHFPSKEALYEAVIVDRIEQMTDQARQLADAGGDPGESFFDFLEMVAEKAMLNLALCDALEGDEHHVADLSAATGFHHQLGRLLARAQEAGAVRDDLESSDMHALIAGYVAIQRRSAGKGLGHVLTDGLRARASR